MNKLKWLGILILWISTGHAQILISTPPYPTENDSLVIVYNAALGNQGLKGFTGDVYAHTGLITAKSSSTSDWKYVKANWSVNLAECKLLRVGTDLYQLIIPSIRPYYLARDTTEKILKLAFVFRSPDGAKQGKETGNKDIFLDLYESSGMSISLIEPQIEQDLNDPRYTPIFVDAQDSLTISAKRVTGNRGLRYFRLWIQDSLVVDQTSDSLQYRFLAMNFYPGLKDIKLLAMDSLNQTDSLHFFVMINPERSLMVRDTTLPAGISYPDVSMAKLCLYAPGKEFIYVLGDFNQWISDTAYLMAKDSAWFWLTIPDLVPGHEYAFQYLIDGKLRLADPYSHKVLDPWNDGSISAQIYPGLINYPTGKTREITSVIQTKQPAYSFQYHDAYQKPDKSQLVIYELLVRDFLAGHTFSQIMDTLSYLKNLGINAVELMPVNEFEGNSSWGYNPSFYFAPDKYYGPAEDLKRLVDECHKLGLVVIMDMVLNHAFGQCPLVRLYLDSSTGKVASNNPWFNVIAPHEYSWGYDYNHQKPATQAWVDRVLRYWIDEYQIDGYRLDFTKGFTNKSGSGWSYDQSRVDILKRLAIGLWSVDSTIYLILEHWADNSEEKALADYGFLLWGHANQTGAENGYYEAAMGYHDQNKSDIAYGFYQTRSWSFPHLVTYMESHDEQRLMYKIVQWGKSSGSYNTKDLATALERMKACAAFFLTLPGPKMIWQFGELGYDVDIDYNGRTGEKPIRWEYYREPLRKRLYGTYQALLHLRQQNEVFRSNQTLAVFSTAGAVKWVRLLHSSMNAVIIGNFDIITGYTISAFPSAGIWYDFFSGDSLNVLRMADTLRLMPGEFHVYTTQKLFRPDSGLITGIEVIQEAPFREFLSLSTWPNPFNVSTRIEFSIPTVSLVNLSVHNLLGGKVAELVNQSLPAGIHRITWKGVNQDNHSLPSGVYFITLSTRQGTTNKKVMILR